MIPRLYTRYLVYKIPYRRALRLAYKGILHTTRYPVFARAWPSAHAWSKMSTPRDLRLYTRYPIVARRAWPTGCIGRVRRASKGILHTRSSVNALESKCILQTLTLILTVTQTLTLGITATLTKLTITHNHNPNSGPLWTSVLVILYKIPYRRARAWPPIFFAVTSLVRNSIKD